MSVRLDKGVILLEGPGALEDATILLDLMLAHADAAIDFDKCTRVHMSVAQILLAARRRVHRPPKEPFLCDWLIPLLAPTE
jgi:hypothetical protein